MSEPAVIKKDGVKPFWAPKHEDTCQVVLHNDDHNEAGYVVQCIMKVFGHSAYVAGKIMLDAHMQGRAVAEVESLTPAIDHRDKLRSHGISATVEKL